MSALTELKSGQPADAFVAVVARTIHSVAIARNFPPPEECERWDNEAVSVMTAEFFASLQTPRRLADLRLRCVSEDGLHRILQAMIRNFLSDIGRRTEVGRLVLRVNGVLGTDRSFERTGDCWRLANMTDEYAVVDLEDLIAVASRIHVNIPTTWRKSSRRKGPDIDKASIIHLARALLMHAKGPLRPSVIAQVVAERLCIGQTPLTVDTVAFDPPQSVETSYDATAEEVLTTIRAEEVLKLLNDSERVAVGLADLSTAALGKTLLVSKSTAAIIKLRAVAIIRAELRDEEQGQEIADIMLSKAREWATEWTDGHNATY